ncbi:hypothetical protein C478_07307 [Natrinema thermotolerans DSM 11552]|nr:hypothetical protein C478_07307 [Natrinema thermotolerans DSM 11552]
MAAWFIVGVIAAAVLAGTAAHMRLGSMSDTIYTTWRVIMSVMWLTSGIALIVGGYVVVGALVVALFWFVLIGGVADLWGTDFRRKLNG